MKNVISKTKYVLMALIMVTTFSCSPEDGADGAQGPAGQDGTNGQDGEDGNANVQTLTFDATAFSGSFDNVTIPQITQDVLDNDAILSYLTDDGNNWVPIPCPFDTYQFDFSVQVTFSIGLFTLDYGDASGNNFSITAGDLQELKVIIIESTSSTSGKSANLSKKESIYVELKNAGVDINNYYDVMNYYGLDY